MPLNFSKRSSSSSNLAKHERKPSFISYIQNNNHHNHHHHHNEQHQLSNNNSASMDMSFLPSRAATAASVPIPTAAAVATNGNGKRPSVFSTTTTSTGDVQLAYGTSYSHNHNGNGSNGGHNNNNNGDDDTFVIEEAHDNYVYQIQIKKIYNTAAVVAANTTSSSSMNGSGHVLFSHSFGGATRSSFISHTNSSTSLGASAGRIGDFFSTTPAPAPPTTPPANAAAAAAAAMSSTLTLPSSFQLADAQHVYTKVKIKHLKYATVDKFVEHLTSEANGMADLPLVKVFLTTYRTFTDTLHVLELMRRRFEQVAPASLDVTEDVRLQHLNSLHLILDIWYASFAEDFDPAAPHTLRHLVELEHLLAAHMTDTPLHKRVRVKLQQSTTLVNNTNNGSSTLDLTTLTLGVDAINFTIDENDSPSPPPPPPPVSECVPVPVHRASVCPPSSSSPPPRPPPPSAAALAHLSHKPPISSCTTMTTTPATSSRALVNSCSSTPQMMRSSSETQQTIATTTAALVAATTTTTTMRGSKFITSLSQSLMSIDSNHFAEQLTYQDKRLFQRICAHHCLGSVWSTRYQNQTSKDSTASTTSAASAVATSASPGSPNVAYSSSSPSSSLSTSSSSTTANSATANAASTAARIKKSNSCSQSSDKLTISDRFSSIRAFIDQFNCVSFVVQTKILEHIEMEPSERAKIITKWVEVALACKRLKNFSSLNAIVQGLNTQCISRLNKTWREVSE